MALAVYNCNWHLSHDMILKKAVILMIQRSQRLQIFKAMGITELNLVSYVTVIFIVVIKGAFLIREISFRL